MKIEKLVPKGAVTWENKTIIDTCNHIIDWDKVKSKNDIITILKGLKLSFDIEKANELLKPYLTKR